MLRRIAIAAAMMASAAMACSCASAGGGPCGVPAGDTIVLARVVSITQTHRVPGTRSRLRVWGSVVVKLAVLERFRGEAREELTVRTESNTAACGYPFREGREYLVFADKFDGKLSVSMCSGTRPAITGASIIRLLRSKRDGTALPTLFGSVLTAPLSESDESIRAVADVTVVAQRGDQEYRTRTAEDGVYAFEGLPPGEYFVHVQAPAHRVALWVGGGERLRTAGGCPGDFQVVVRQ